MLEAMSGIPSTIKNQTVIKEKLSNGKGIALPLIFLLLAVLGIEPMGPLPLSYIPSPIFLRQGLTELPRLALNLRSRSSSFHLPSNGL